MTSYKRRMKRLEGKPLGTREHEAWQYLVQGLTSKETAKKMKIAEQTVITMRKIVYAKLGVRNLAEAIGRWYQEK